MSDKIHANWIALTVPTWEEIKPPHTLERYVIDKQAAEIDALRKRVQGLEAAQQWRPIECRKPHSGSTARGMGQSG